MLRLNQLLSCSTEEQLHHGDLQECHSHHQQHLENRKVVDPRLRRLDSGMVSVVSGFVILQSSLKVVQLLIDFFDCREHVTDMLERLGVGLVWQVGPEVRMVVFSKCDFKINHFFSKRRHAVGKAHLILSSYISKNDKFSLSFLLSQVNDLSSWVFDGIVNVKGTPTLNGKVIADGRFGFFDQNVVALGFLSSKRKGESRGRNQQNKGEEPNKNSCRTRETSKHYEVVVVVI